MLELIELPKDTRSFEVKVDGKVVGFIAWRQAVEWSSRGHVSYEIAEEHRCKGYAKGALKTLLQHIELEYGNEFDKVQICCAVDNVASRCVVERCGGERDTSRGEIFRDPTDGKWTVSYWVPVKNMVDTAEQKS